MAAYIVPSPFIRAANFLGADLLSTQVGARSVPGQRVRATQQVSCRVQVAFFGDFDEKSAVRRKRGKKGNRAG